MRWIRDTVRRTTGRPDARRPAARAPRDTGDARDRWPARKALAFMIGASVLLWGLIAVAFRLLR